MSAILRHHCTRTRAPSNDQGSDPYGDCGAPLSNWRDRLLLDPQDKGFLRSHLLRSDVSTEGYQRVRATCRETRKTTVLSRLIMGAKNGEVVDHINGNPMDNRRSNLRVCKPSDNAKNRGKQAGSSRYKGLTWYKNKWFAQIAANGKKHYLGLFTDEELAARAYDKAARELHGQFARLNFPDNPDVIHDDHGVPGVFA